MLGDRGLMSGTNLKMDVIDTDAHVVENERVWDYLEAGNRTILSGDLRSYGI